MIEEVYQSSHTTNNGAVGLVTGPVNQEKAHRVEQIDDAPLALVKWSSAPQDLVIAPTSKLGLRDNQPTDSLASHPKDLGRRNTLDIAKRIFSTVDIISGTIPGVGNYIGAGAKVGLACVGMVQVRRFFASHFHTQPQIS